MAVGAIPTFDEFKKQQGIPSFDEFQPAPAPSNDPPQAIQEPKGHAASRFGGGLWDNTIGGLGKAAKMLYHVSTPSPGNMPNIEAIQDMHDIVQSHIDQAKKAKESWDQGEHVEAIGHGMAAALPLVGPAAAHAGERIGGTAPEFDKYGSVVKQGQAPDVAGGLGEAAGLIVGSSPRNIVKPLAGGIGTAVSKIAPERITPEGMYQSSLRPSLARKNLPKIDAKVATGLREGVPVSRGGLENLNATVDGLNAQIANKIAAQSVAQGPVINPLDVTKPVNKLKPTFANQVNPNADMATINSVKQEFLDKHSSGPYTKIAPSPPNIGGFKPVGVGKTKQPLTISEAQAEKQGTYTQLRKKYGELGSADVEAQKALARGLKDEIAKRVPEVSDLNAREGALLELQTELEKMVAREGNKNLLGLVPATMTHNPFGFLATLAMDNPAIKSRIAIALSRARQLKGMPSNAAATAGAASAGGDSTRNIPNFAKGGIIKRPAYIVDAKMGKTVGLMAENGPEAIVPLPHSKFNLRKQSKHIFAGSTEAPPPFRSRGAS